MNLTVYRHLSIPLLVMRGVLRFILEGSGEFEVVGHARDGEEAVVVWAVGSGLLRRFAAAAHCGEAAPHQAGRRH